MVVAARTRGLARLALPYPVARAQQHETVTYKERAVSIGTHPVPLRFPLGYIRAEICEPRGLPLISTIVVDPCTGLPGDGFLAGDLTSYGGRIRQAGGGSITGIHAPKGADMKRRTSAIVRRTRSSQTGKRWTTCLATRSATT